MLRRFGRSRNVVSEKKHWFDYVAVASACSACVAALFLSYQGWVARDTAKRQLRAYVLVSQSDATISAPNNAQIRVQLKNFGLTPAYKLSGWSCMIVGRFSKDVVGNVGLETNFPVPPFNEKQAQNTVLAPQDSEEVFLFPHFCNGGLEEVRSITRDEISRIQNGTAAIYLYGEHHYFDAFGNRHFLKYRVVGSAAARLMPTKAMMLIERN
jgi:hypothetical protein